MNNELTLVAQESGIDENKIQTLMSSFGKAYEEARGLVKEAKKISVTSEKQKDEMQLARQVRLDLKGTRVKVEKVRKELKEQSLREGKAIDGMANIIKALIVPMEEYLEDQEKFAERIQVQKEIKIEQDRVVSLGRYVEDVEVYDLHPKRMLDETFCKLLETSRVAFNAQKEAEKKAEEESVAKLKAEREEQERIREENEKLKTEAEAREKKEAKLKAIQEAKLKAEREKREAIEVKLNKEREAIQKAKEARKAKDEAERVVAEEEKRKALLAPDKEKMFILADKLYNFDLPNMSNRESGKIVDEVRNELCRIAEILREKAKSL